MRCASRLLDDYEHLAPPIEPTEQQEMNALTHGRRVNHCFPLGQYRDRNIAFSTRSPAADLFAETASRQKTSHISHAIARKSILTSA